MPIVGIPPSPERRQESGVASLLLLFSMSAFTVLGVGELSTSLGSAPAGKTFSLFRAMPHEALLKFVAPMVVPNDWRTEGAQGSYQFQLPVLVPQTGSEESGSTSAWHTMSEVPGMAVCCESRAGICNARNVPVGGAPISDWTPGTDDAMRLSFDLSSRPDAQVADAPAGDTVTATVTATASAPPTDATALACQLEWDGAVIAKGTAFLRQVPRDGGNGVTSSSVEGTMTLAVKTK
jgi:hypothetical protein